MAQPALSEAEWRAACIYYKAADTSASTVLIRDIGVTCHAIASRPAVALREGWLA